MKFSKHLHQSIAVRQSLLTLALMSVITLLAWLTTIYPVQTDITRHSSNTLSPASLKLLDALPESVEITAYIKKGLPLRLQIAQLIERYHRHKADLTLNFIDPDDQPEKARELGIGSEGLVLVEYRGHSEKLNFVDESTLTNALLQLANANERWVSFLTGHGERSPDGIANFDLGQFGKELARRKITALNINLATIPSIPNNSSLLVIAAPTVPLLAGEIGLIKQYIQRGGNLLLMTDPDNKYLAELLKEVGIHQQQGAIIDSRGKLYGIDNPSFVIVNAYPDHVITRGLQIITLYPVAAALEKDSGSAFQAQIFLKSMPKTWLETGKLSGGISFDEHSKDRAGPIDFGYALTRPINKTSEQRIIVLGDSDFLSNTYLGNVGNLDMGLRIFNWLLQNDQYIDIPPKTATDKTLTLSPTTVAIIGFGFLIVVPLVLLISGIVIWRLRKRH